ncbi:hypothetical protein PT273_08745 [Orbaceae bacterium ESL0727]|nr:hypothetical protein [Orbaceae bacterium ESL0727]
MMSAAYITLLNLAERPGLVELSQSVAQDGEIPCDSKLLETIINNQDTSACRPFDDVTNANVAILRINEAIDDAHAEIEGFYVNEGISYR